MGDDRRIRCRNCCSEVRQAAYCSQCGESLAEEPAIQSQPARNAGVGSAVSMSPGRPTTRRNSAWGVVAASSAVLVIGFVVVLLAGRRDESTSSGSPDTTYQAAVPATTRAPVPATTAAPSADATTSSPGTTAAVVATTVPPAVVSTETIEPKPFRRTFASISQLPSMPTAVRGYVPASVARSEVRLFGREFEFSIDEYLDALPRRCEEVFWVARWTLHIPDFRVDATEEIGLSGPEFYEVEPWLLPEPGTAGLLGNQGCFRPGFRLADDSDGLIVDVIVEIQYFKIDRFAGSQGQDSSGTDVTVPLTVVPSCIDYTYDDELPISVCARGYSVTLFQEALGIEADGYFGPGTQRKVLEFQGRVGLPRTGFIDVATWSALGVMANAPYPDINGDGVIDGSEVPGT